MRSWVKSHVTPYVAAVPIALLIILGYEAEITPPKTYADAVLVHKGN